MASATQARLFDTFDLTEAMWGWPTPEPMPSIKQMYDAVHTYSRLLFFIGYKYGDHPPPDVAKIQAELQNAMEIILKSIDWEIHQMTWTIHEWHRRIAWPSTDWGGEAYGLQRRRPQR